MSILTPHEEHLVRKLWKLRDEDHKAGHGKDARQHIDERNRLVEALLKDERAIQHAARKSKLRGGGWNRHHRAGRFQIVHLTRLNHKAGRPEVWDRPEKTLRERALAIAHTQVGVMEHGGNNQGAKVYQYIRENGGMGPEPWCGDFVAFCYRHAGSRAVTRGWAMALFTGAGRRTIAKPEPGDIVEYGFAHTGLFDHWVSSGTMDTIEGNTGASGAVSDSATGGDGVYEKHRSTSLVARYQRVLR